MTLLFGCLSLILLVVVLALGIATSVVSGRFFKQLVIWNPELEGEFPRDPLFTFGHTSQPLASSRMKYLKEHRYETVSDPALRQLGRRSWSLLAAYAITFTALVISSLAWGYFHNNA